MNKWAMLLGAAIVAAVSGSTDAAFVDGTFEATNIGTNTYVYNPPSTTYSFTGNSGLANGQNAFGNPGASGNYAFLQTNSAQTSTQGTGVRGVISQTFTLDAGSYTLSFLNANRGPGQSSFTISLDGTTIATISPTSTTLAATNLTVVLQPTATHTLTFTAAGPVTQDTTTFLDNIAFTPASTTAVPEPTSLALLGLGLVGVGFVGRQRRA